MSDYCLCDTCVLAEMDKEYFTDKCECDNCNCGPFCSCHKEFQYELFQNNKNKISHQGTFVWLIIIVLIIFIFVFVLF